MSIMKFPILHEKVANQNTTPLIGREKKYLGIGPSAHSFDGDSRQWNIANNGVYVRSIQKDEVFYERELLDQRTKLNEYIMTGLRTSRGIQLDYIEKAFGIDLINTHAELIQELIHTGKMLQANSQLKLTAQGFLLAYRIASEFFIVE